LPVYEGIGTGKVHPRRDHEGPEGEYRYSSILSLTLALDGVEHFVYWCCSLPVYEGIGTGKVHPRRDHEGPEGEYRYSSILSLTLALDGVGDQCHAPDVLPLGKTRYPLYRKLGEP